MAYFPLLLQTALLKTSMMELEKELEILFLITLAASATYFPSPVLTGQLERILGEELHSQDPPCPTSLKDMMAPEEMGGVHRYTLVCTHTRQVWAVTFAAVLGAGLTWLGQSLLLTSYQACIILTVFPTSYLGHVHTVCCVCWQ